MQYLFWEETMYKGLNLIMPGTTSRITCHEWANRLQLRFRENLLVLTDFQTREYSVGVGLSQNAQGTIYTLPEIPLRSQVDAGNFRQLQNRPGRHLGAPLAEIWPT